MRISPKMQALGCFSSLLSIGAFVSGAYQGLSEAKGIQIDPGLKEFIRYGPIALNALLSFPIMDSVLDEPENLDEMVSKAPIYVGREQAEQVAKGCSSVLFPIISAATTGAFELAGYYLGKAVGSTV